MSDELTLDFGLGATGVSGKSYSPLGTKGGLNALYLPRRGSFELHGLTGKGFYVWRDGTFNNDDLSYVDVVALPVKGGTIGSLYHSRGAKFFIFFGTEIITTTAPFGLPVYAMFWTVDQKSYFQWPTSCGALKFDIPPPASAGTVATPTGEDVAQNVGNGSTFERHGLAWKVSLSHQDVVKLDEDAAIASELVPEPDIVLAIEAAVTIITTVDTLGGNVGVDITGVLPTTAIFVTPRGSIDIIRVIEIVGGVVTKVLDETAAGVKAGFKAVSDGFNQLSDAAGKAWKGVEDLGKRIGIKF